MKKDNQQLLLYAGGLAILYFGIIRPILKKTGIQQSAEEQAQETQVSQTSVSTNAGNPFSPIFYQTSAAQNAHAKLFTVAYATSLADRIYNALGYFYDDEAAVVAVFRLFKTKSQVSFVADIFQKKYKTDLFDFLRKGKGIMPEAGLNTSELSELISIVNKLPNYK